MANVSVHWPADLGVNVDHVATVRQARRAEYPDPVAAALMAELAGAAQITVHLREDRRHIQDRDVEILRKTIATRLNLEMATTPEMLKIALAIKPDTVTLVPERREEITTEGGLDVRHQKESIKRLVGSLRDAGIQTMLFIDPTPEQVKASHWTEASGIELHTGAYANARGEKARQEEMVRLTDALQMGAKLKLRLAAGHGLNYANIAPLVQQSFAGPRIEEFNIGHSIVARAVLVGMVEAVREMVRLLSCAS